MEQKFYGFVYITTNNINGKKYIGQKKYDEKGKYESYLGSGIALNNAIKKYGREHFSKEIIENCSTPEELNAREKYWINYYNAVKSKDFYNIASGGDGGNTTAGYTPEQKKELSVKCSKALKGVINQRGNNPSAKRVICLNTMKVFECTVDAEEFYNIPPNRVYKAANPNDGVRTAGVDPITGDKLLWEYYEEGKEYYYIPFKRDYHDPDHNSSKKVYCFELDMFFNSVKEAGEYLGITPRLISHHLKRPGTSVGKHLLNKEYHFSYA